MTKPKVELRNSALDPLGVWPGSSGTLFGRSTSGVQVSVDTAMSSTAVFAAFRLVADSVGRLPLPLIERSSETDETVKLRDDPRFIMLNSVGNRWQTAFTVRRMMQMQVMAYGNAYAFKQFDGNGVTAEWFPLRADRIKIIWRDSEPVYVYRDEETGQPVEYQRSQIVHYSGISFGGLLGNSLIDIGKHAIGLSLAQEEYSARIFKNGSVPGGILKHPMALSKEAKDNITESWALDHQGLGKAHTVAVLEEGMDWVAVGISPEDAELIAGRTFQISEVSRITGIPLPFLAELSHATFSNIEFQGRELVTYGLAPWFTLIEQQLAMDLLNADERRTMFFEHNADAFLRGDSKTQAEVLNLSTGGPFMAVNEARRLLNLAPSEDPKFDTIRDGFQGQTQAAGQTEDEGNGESNRA